MRTQLISYLDAGGSVYFEGNDIGYNNKGYDIWPYTGLTYVGDGAAATTGNVQSISGSYMCSGISFDYPYKTEPDGYVDDFSPNGGAILFASQDGKGRVGFYDGPTQNYRTITSSVFFSVFQETGTTREELMVCYRNYLLGGTGTAEETSSTVSNIAVTVANPSTGMLSATVVLPGAANCDLGVYDVSGRRVGTLAAGTVSAGSHTFIMSGADLSAGTYLICGEAGGNRVSERTVLLK